ncbi:MAG: tetratricopeptide repeat protein, partial [Phycisphaerae bacterium]|nr:tetratricopeptide repeat protein [Phycisphaerae bacterium]
CEPGKAEYQGKQAQYYLMRSAYSISPQADLEKAYHLLRRIQYHSDAAIPTGVDRPALMGIRFNHILEPLIRVCTELAKGSEDSQAAAAYLAEANAAYKDVELEFDRNNPYIKLFLQLSRGIIDLAGSHEEAGLKMLYETHAFMVDQKEKGQAISEELLNRTQEELFKALHAGTYKLLATQYGLESRFWQRRPGQATLDLLEALIRVGTNSHKKTAISLADYYLQDAGQIDHWRDQVLLAKARARIGLEELEDASAILQSLNSNSVDVRLLHIQTLTNIKEQIPLLEQMAVDFPENPTIIASLIQYYFNQGRSDSVLYDRARALLTQALKTDPDNFTYRRMMTILNEPGTLPHMIEAKRFFDIEIEVRQAIKDPLKRFRTLGVFYTNSAMKAKTDAQALLAKAKTDAAKDKAQSEADRSEALWAKAREAFEKTIKLEPADDQQAYGHLFKIAIATEDWAVAQSLVKKIAGQDATQGLLAEGQLAITRQQWSQAADVLKVYLGKTPISPQGHFDLALCYQNLNQAQNALDEARIAEKQSPGNSRIQILINELQYAVAIQSSKGVARQEEGLKLSNLYMAYGDQAAQKMRTAEAQSEYDKAQKELDRILKEDPEHVEASKAMRQLKIKLGSLALRMADYEKARSYAEAILAVEPDHQLAGLLKCESFFYNGQYELAESMLLSLRKKEPATSTFGQALLAKVYWQMGRKDEGIAQLQVALKSQPNNMGIIRLLDQMLKSSKRWGDLEAMYNGLLSQHPDSINLYYDACRIAWMQDKNDKALEYMRRAWAKDTNPDTLNGLLQALLKVKNYREILSLVDGNLKGNSFDILLLLHKAEATWGLGRDKEALSIFANVLERVQTEPIATKLIVLNSVSRVGAPDSIQAWAGEMIRQKPTSSIMYQVSATIYSLQAKHEQEISALLKALEFSSGSDETAIIYRHLATAYLKTKNYGKCIEYYRLLLKTAPDNVSVLNNLAYALMEQGDQNGEALTIASKAYALSPDNPLIMDTYALSLIHKKEYVQAETISRKVIQEMQRQGQDVPVEFEYRLGQALVGQNRMAEAQKQLKPVLEKLKVAPDSKNNTMWQEKIADLLK